ncbi:hypothetical protein FIU97_02795 [Roseivivax sp. THAF40]|nr:hypothetical protein FIU97_02795 [Roseivivax sp. THAF40]
MLYKSLISTYGASLAAASTPTDDPVWHMCRSQELTLFREYALNALQQAKVYLLDHLAANYADTLHDAIQENAEANGMPAMATLGEVQPPSKITWVEFDYRALAVDRFQRGSLTTVHDKEPIGSGLRGYLIDDRSLNYLRISMFSRPEGSSIMDPICSLLINKKADGRLEYDNLSEDLSRSMVNYYVHIGYPAEKIDTLRVLHRIDTGSDLFIPYAVFAMLASPDLGGIIPSETETFAPKQTKTARKFGKFWVLGAQKSHITIRIGPQAVAHMREREQRLDFERKSQAERQGPVRHWVSEHERHYKNGKVVLVKAHPRGRKSESHLPTRVMGPSLDSPDFILKQKK